MFIHTYRPPSDSCSQKHTVINSRTRLTTINTTACLTHHDCVYVKLCKVEALHRECIIHDVTPRFTNFTVLWRWRHAVFIDKKACSVLTSLHSRNRMRVTISEDKNDANSKINFQWMNQSSSKTHTQHYSGRIAKNTSCTVEMDLPMIPQARYQKDSSMLVCWGFLPEQPFLHQPKICSSSLAQKNSYHFN